MSDNKLDQLPAHNRVSIRAVLVTGDADPTAALRAAGIFDPVVIPVVLSDAAVLPAGMLGDGRTPNLTGVLEMDRQDASASSPATRSGSARPDADGDPPSGPVTTTLPAAFGVRSFAPIRRRPREQAADSAADAAWDQAGLQDTD